MMPNKLLCREIDTSVHLNRKDKLNDGDTIEDLLIAIQPMALSTKPECEFVPKIIKFTVLLLAKRENEQHKQFQNC